MAAGAILRRWAVAQWQSIRLIPGRSQVRFLRALFEGVDRQVRFPESDEKQAESGGREIMASYTKWRWSLEWWWRDWDLGFCEMNGGRWQAFDIGPLRITRKRDVSW